MIQIKWNYFFERIKNTLPIGFDDYSSVIRILYAIYMMRKTEIYQ